MEQNRLLGISLVFLGKAAIANLFTINSREGDCLQVQTGDGMEVMSKTKMMEGAAYTKAPYSINHGRPSSLPSSGQYRK